MRVEAPCLDCGDQLEVVMRDEEVLSVEPGTMVGYSYSEFPGGHRPATGRGVEPV